MSLSNVNIKKQEGGLARTPTSTDGISGFVGYGSSTSGTYKLFSSKDVEDWTDDVFKYHIEQYFTFSNYPLYIKLTTEDADDFSEVVDLKNYSNGEIQQVAIFNYSTEFSTSQITAIQAIAEQCEDEKAPLVAIYTADCGSAGVAGLSDLSTLSAEMVHYTVGESLSGKAAELRSSSGNFVSDIGTKLGVLSRSKVHENIGWVRPNNLINGAEFTEAGFIDGTNIKDVSKSFLDTLDTYHIGFVRTIDGGYEGVYFNYSYTATANTSDFLTLENNRVWNKAFRLVRKMLVPEINSPSYFDRSGKLSSGTIKYFKNLASKGLKALKDADEISEFEVSIDPNQNVLATNKLVIVAKIILVGTNKYIDVELGFTTSF